MIIKKGFLGGGETYLLHEIFHFGPKRVFTLRGNGEVKFLLCSVFNVIVEVSEVGGGLEVYFPVVRIHCSSLARGRKGRVEVQRFSAIQIHLRWGSGSIVLGVIWRFFEFEV